MKGEYTKLDNFHKKEASKIELTIQGRVILETISILYLLYTVVLSFYITDKAKEKKELIVSAVLLSGAVTTLILITN